jgi:signal peptidase I
MNQDDNPFLDPEVVKPRRSKRIVDIMQTLVIFIFFLIITYLFILTPNIVNGTSMVPNFQDKQLVFTFRLPQVLGETDFGKGAGLNYQRGDVIILQKPGLDELIKRVIALPGDRIALRQGRVYVNDRLVIEKYLAPDLLTPEGSYLTDGGPAITVEPEHLFVMGDNRPNSLDSRFTDLGQVKREWVIGKVILRVYPFDVFGGIGRGEYTEE